METIIKILMKRDKMTRNEAKVLVDEVYEEINYCLEQGDYDGAEDLVMSELGLEPDYLEILLTE